MAIALTISDSIFYVSVGTYSLSEQSRKKRLNHVALIALDVFIPFVAQRKKGQFKNTRRRLHAGWYFPSNLFTLHFYLLQEAIAYFPLMILVSGILMSGGIKRLNRFFSNRVCIRQGQSTTAFSRIL